jgi:integrase
MSNQNPIPTPARRSYGTGTLYVNTDRNGREVFYGRGHRNGKRLNRRLGLKRGPNTRDGLTRTQAEARLAELIGSAETAPTTAGTMTVEEVGRRYLLHAQRRGRKPSTIANVESELRVHVHPFFAGKPLDTISSHDVAEFVTTLERNVGPKTVRNVVASLSAVCNFAKSPQRGWLTSNPCDGVELPAVPEATAIRFLTLDGIDLLVEHARPGVYHDLDRALYRTAAMTGLRRGELLALRWHDVDWLAQVIRVHQNYVRGQFGTPKSKRSTRSVPMALEVAAELERLSQTSRYTDDDDLVFAHPATGQPLYVAGIGRRMRKALRAAGLNEAHRFHDLRHTFGTQCAAAGVPMRTLQEWMGHKDIKTTQRYADYSPSSREADMIAAAFAPESTEPVAAKGI